MRGNGPWSLGRCTFPSSPHPLIPSSPHPLIHSSPHPLIPSPPHPLIPSSRHPLIRTSSVFIRVEFVLARHCDAQWVEGVQDSNGSLVVREHFGQPLVAVRR